MRVPPPPAVAVEPLAAPPTFSVVIPAYQAAGTVGSGDPLGAGPAPSRRRGDRRRRRVHRRPRRRAAPVRRADHAGAQANGGRASALNAGAAAAQADFLALLDADDVYHPRRLEALAELAAARPDLDLVTTDARFVVDGRPSAPSPGTTPSPTADQRAGILRACFVGGWPAMRLERLRAVGGFDESLPAAVRLGLLDAADPGRLARGHGRRAPLRLPPASGKHVRPPRHQPLGTGSHPGEGVGGSNARASRAQDSLHNAPYPEEQGGAGRGGPAVGEPGSRRRMARLALARGIRPSARARAALAVAAPGLVRRLSAAEAPPDARFKAPG